MTRGLGDRNELARYLSLAQVGVEMVVPVGLGVYVDHSWGLGPWGVIVGAVLGLTLGLVHLVVVASKDDPPRNKGTGENR